MSAKPGCGCIHSLARRTPGRLLKSLRR
jgi:hypothetical protein